MAKAKKFAVRMVMENGRRVKAEIEGIGRAGEESFRRMSQQVDMAGVMLGRLARIAIGALSIRQVVDYTNRWADMRTSLRLATGSMEAGEAVLDRLTQVARRTTSDLGDIVDGFLSFSTTLRELGLSTRQQLDFVETLSTALDISGKRGAEAERVQNALSRAMMLGTLSGTNLTTVLQSGGRVTRALADSMGVATTDLLELGRAGKITRADILGITSEMEKLREEAGDSVSTIADGFRMLGNAALQLVGTWDTVIGGSGLVAEVLLTLADNLEHVAVAAIALGTYMAGAWVVSFVAAKGATAALTMGLVALKSALIRTGIGALVVAAGELVYWFGRAVAAGASMGEAFRLVANVAIEVGARINLAFNAAFALLGVAWEGWRSLVYTILDLVVQGVVKAADRIVASFKGAFEAIKAIWGALPGAIADFAYQAANGLIGGIESMLNAVVTRINRFIGGLNWALSALPEWATGEGGVRINLLEDVSLGGIDNPYTGAASAAGAAAGEAFSAALAETYFEAPTVFGDLSDEALAAADEYAAAAAEFGAAAIAPLESWEALQAVIAASAGDGEDALDEAQDAASRLGDALENAGRAGGGAGRAVAEGAAMAATGWARVAESLDDYADKARDISGDIGQALVRAFQSAENAVGDFVKTGKLKFSELVTSLIADLSKLGARKFILGPLAGALANVMPGLGGGVLAGVMHDGGMVGAPGPSRMVPAMALSSAPRFHEGGWPGLRPDEVLTILQRGERVQSRREVAAGVGGGVTVNIQALDAESFRQSRAQIAADIARAVSFGRRGM